LTINIEGKDIVACVAIIILGIDVALGMDGVLIPIIATVVGWYFGTKSKA
jgi:uncharacterized membrane protein YqgA involved in biofilm formation